MFALEMRLANLGGGVWLKGASWASWRAVFGLKARFGRRHLA